jgi:hypothetical protein
MSATFRNEFLAEANPKKTSMTRGEVYEQIAALDPTPLQIENAWPHACSADAVWNCDRLQDPPGYQRGDDYVYTEERHKINFTAANIEELRFTNAWYYLEKLKALKKGADEKGLSKHLREAYHPNKFGTAMNLQADILKRSDWLGQFRPRHAQIHGSFLVIFDSKESLKQRLAIKITGCKVTGYDAQAANTNRNCDLYGLGFTEDQARRTLSISSKDRMKFFFILPTYEERIEWLYVLKRKAELDDKDAQKTGFLCEIKGYAAGAMRQMRIFAGDETTKAATQATKMPL